MIAALNLSRRAWIGLALVAFAAVVLLFPLRLAFGLFGLEKAGISARGVHGLIWSGTVDQLRIANIPLGTVDAGLSPLALFTGTARLNVSRQVGAPDDIRGGVTVRATGFGLEDMTASLAAGNILSPLPVSGVDLSGVTVRFDGKLCARAQGQVKARMATSIPGLNLSQGLTGTATCDGDALFLPMVSQSGLEKLNLRLSGDGSYTAQFIVNTQDEALSAELSRDGFAMTQEGQVLRITGSM